jgi:hypothetical protein
VQEIQAGSWRFFKDSPDAMCCYCMNVNDSRLQIFVSGPMSVDTNISAYNTRTALPFHAAMNARLA